MKDIGDSYERNKDGDSCRGYKSAGWLHISRGSFPGRRERDRSDCDAFGRKRMGKETVGGFVIC